MRTADDQPADKATDKQIQFALDLAKEHGKDYTKSKLQGMSKKEVSDAIDEMDKLPKKPTEKQVSFALDLIKEQGKSGPTKDKLEKMPAENVSKLIDKLKTAGRLDGARGHMLMPSALKSKIPRMRAQEDVDDPIVYAKFFSPYSGAVWLITEFDGNDEMFGWADLGFGMGELGYISLRELENSNKRGLPLVERDTSFRPMPLSKAKRQNRNASMTKKAKLIRIAMKRAQENPEFRKKLVAHLRAKKV